MSLGKKTHFIIKGILLALFLTTFLLGLNSLALFAQGDCYSVSFKCDSMNVERTDIARYKLNEKITVNSYLSFRFAEIEGIMTCILKYHNWSYETTVKQNVDLGIAATLGFYDRDGERHLLWFEITRNQDKWFLFWWAWTIIIGFIYGDLDGIIKLVSHSVDLVNDEENVNRSLTKEEKKQ